MKKTLVVLLSAMLTFTSCNWLGTDVYADEQKTEDSGRDSMESELETISADSAKNESDSSSADKTGEVGSFSYSIHNGEATIIHCDTSVTGEITIPSTIDGVKVTSIGEWAFDGCYTLTGVTIPDGVINIDNYAFVFCEKITSVIIPDSVKNIGVQVFGGCSNLKKVTLPEGITSIGEGAFSRCTSLSSIDIPASVEKIGEGAFAQCTKLIEIGVKDNNAYYTSEGGVLYNKKKTELHTWPAGMKGDAEILNSVTSIDDYAFSGCDDITNITIPNGVTSIGKSSFDGCVGITSINIPDSVKNIGDSAFVKCSELSNIVIPDSVVSMGTDLFGGCSNLKSIVLPKGVDQINDYTFLACTGLTNYTIPDSVTYLGESAFNGCSGLTKMIIPDSVTTMGICVFEDCAGLENVILPKNLTLISGYAFENCFRLRSITIPSAVTKIDVNAFDCCNALTDVYYSGSKEQWNHISISDGNDYLKNATIHYSSKIPSKIKKVEVTSAKSSVIRGTTQQMTAIVSGDDGADTSVTWKVEGNSSKKTSVSKDGLLKIGSDEKNSSLKVTATANADTSKFASITMKVQAFKDVSDGQFYNEAVLWGMDHNVIAGYSESDGTSTFRPDDHCTRAQFVTFLWRTFGSQKPKSTKNPFVDIPNIQNVYYCDAVLWAYENGYVSGYSDPKGVRFGADDEVTRGQVVTFLWRAAGAPKPASSKSAFVDVKNPSSQYYGTAMLWASENGIVSGYSDPKGARFAPDDSCTRGQVVTFLWRYAQKFLQ